MDELAIRRMAKRARERLSRLADGGGTLFMSAECAIQLQMENGMTREEAQAWVDSLPVDSEAE